MVRLGLDPVSFWIVSIIHPWPFVIASIWWTEKPR
jgi:hypothetical protein